MKLTELNALYTYLERCKAGARIFTDVMSKLTEQEQRKDQEFIANALAQSWQVDRCDLLAETNKTSKKK